MEKLEILKEISRKQFEIAEELKKENSDLKEYREFFEKYNTSSLRSLAEIDTIDFAIFLAKSLNPEVFSFDELGHALEMNRELFENLDLEDFQDVLAELIDFYNAEPNAKKIITEKKKSKNSHFQNMMIILASYEDIDTSKLDLLVDLIIKDGDSMVTTVGLAKYLRMIKSKYETIDDELDIVLEEGGYGRVKDKERQRIIDENFKQEYNVRKIRDDANVIRNHYENLERSERSYKRKLGRQLASYETLETAFFQALEKGEVTTVNSMINKIEDENIRKKILIAVYNHNNEIYKEILKEYRELNQNSSIKYQRLLETYGISPNTYEVETIMDKSLDDVEQMLVIITKHGLKEPNYILKAIQNSDLETLESLNELLKKGIINPTLLRNHPKILDPTSKENKNLDDNMRFLNSQSINPHYFRSCQETLMLDPTLLEKNIGILKEYKLLTSMKTGIDCSFLSYDNIEKSIDTLLELGYEKLLEDNLILLNYQENFPRLIALKELNIPVSNVEELITILSSSKFLIPDTEINDYIYNAAENRINKIMDGTYQPENKYDWNRLHKLDNSARVYNFDGVLISKNKFLRNSEELSNLVPEEHILLCALFKDSVLSDEELEKIDTIMVKGRSVNPVKEKK